MAIISLNIFLALSSLRHFYYTDVKTLDIVPKVLKSFIFISLFSLHFILDGFYYHFHLLSLSFSPLFFSSCFFFFFNLNSGVLEYHYKSFLDMLDC